MNNFYFTNLEIIILLSLTITILLPFKLINKKNRISIINPLIIYSLIIGYYSLVSPFYAVITDRTINKGLEYREFLIYGWIGALLSLVFIYIGYFFQREVNLKD